MRPHLLACSLVGLSSLLAACESSSSPEASSNNAIAATPTAETVQAEPTMTQKGTVTLSPPSPPAGPIPIPYPNVAAAKEPAKKSGVAAKQGTLEPSTQPVR